MNLAPCGDNDGGLVVLKGGHEVSKEYHDAFRQEERGFRWTNEVCGTATHCPLAQLIDVIPIDVPL